MHTKANPENFAIILKKRRLNLHVTILETAIQRAKMGEIWDLATSRKYIGCLLPQCSRSFGVIQCTCLKMTCNSNTSGHKVKRIEIGTW